MVGISGIDDTGGGGGGLGTSLEKWLLHEGSNDGAFTSFAGIATSQQPAVLNIDTNKYIVAYRAITTGYPTVVVATVNPSTLVLSFGTPVTLEAVANNITKIIKSSTTEFTVLVDGQRITACTFDGSTSITAGTTLVATNGFRAFAVGNTTKTTFIACRNTTTDLYMRYYTVNYTTRVVTEGTETSIRTLTNTPTSASGISIDVPEDARAVIVFVDKTGSNQAAWVGVYTFDEAGSSAPSESTTAVHLFSNEIDASAPLDSVNFPQDTFMRLSDGAIVTYFPHLSKMGFSSQRGWTAPFTYTLSSGALGTAGLAVDQGEGLMLDHTSSTHIIPKEGVGFTVTRGHEADNIRMTPMVVTDLGSGITPKQVVRSMNHDILTPNPANIVFTNDSYAAAMEDDNSIALFVAHGAPSSGDAVWLKAMKPSVV